MRTNEKGILFNREMVQAILDGRKTVTRRVIKPQPGEMLAYISGGSHHGKWGYSPYEEETYEVHRAAGDWKYWTPPCHGDDLLYVRETWRPGANGSYLYRADFDLSEEMSFAKWHPSIHMPKEAARIWLKVKRVSVSRIQDITADDIRAEGLASAAVHIGDMKIAREEFRILWDSTIKKTEINLYGWDANPYAWVVEFEKNEKGKVTK